MSNIDSILHRIQSQIASSRVRVKDFFADYDPLHSGAVTRNQFIRVLDICRILASPSEINCICDHYSIDGLNDKVRYGSFVDRIESVKHLEKTPTLPVDELYPVLSGKVTYGQSLTDEERSKLAVLLKRCAGEVKTRGIIVDAFFKDFDKRNSGFVTETQFRREAQACFDNPPLLHSDIDILVKAYGHDVGATGGDGKSLIDINYRAFHNDVGDKEERAGGASHSALRLARKVDHTSKHQVDKVLDSITRQVVERRLRLKDYFKDFDSLRSGFVTADVFRRVLQFANLKAVSNDEINLIIDRFLISNEGGGRVAYQEFIKTVDYSSSLDALERKPTAKAQSHALEVAKLPRRGIHLLSDAEEKSLEYVITPIRENIRQKRISLLEKFEDFDRQHEESVSANQFDRVLSEFFLLPRKGSDVELLHRKFAAIPSSTGGMGPSYTGTFGPRIDYKFFLEAVGAKLGRDSDRDSNEQSKQLTALEQKKADNGLAFSLSRVSLDSPSAADELLSIIKRKLVQKRIRIREYLADGDKLRHGSITFNQFFRSLDIAGLGLNKREVEVLASKYANDLIKDHSGVPHIRWSDFADDVDSVFTVKNLEKMPTANVDSYISKSLANESLPHEPRLTEEENKILLQVLSDIKVVVSKRRIEITPAFDDFDWQGRGYIPASQFKRALSSLRIADGLPSSSIEIICKAFEVPAEDHRNDVHYKWFVAALESDTDKILRSLPGKGEPLQNLSSVCTSDDQSTSTETLFSNRKKAPVKLQSVDVTSLLERMKDNISTKNIRVSMFMEDFDKLRTGNMSVAKFRTALSAAGFSLSEAEFVALETKFVSSLSSDRVDWKPLASYLDGVGERLERNPTKRVVRSQRAAPEGYNSVKPEQLANILLKCRAHIRTHNSLPKPYFQARDFNHQGLVTPSQFRSVLDFLNLNRGLKEEEVKILLQAFMSSKCGNTDKVDYVRFCNDIDKADL